jgi:type III secretory pathway component EscT
VTLVLPLATLLGPTLLCALRLLPLAMTSPFLGGPVVPAPVRAGLALGLGAVAAHLSGAAAPGEVLPWARAAAVELAAGTILAFLASVPVEAARTAGRLADTFRGVTLSELHVAPIRQRESASGDLLAQSVLALAALGGAERLLVRGILGSFAVLAPGAAFAAAPASELVLGGAAELLACAMALSAPVAAGSLAADLTVSLANRLSPSLAAASAGPQARAAVGLWLLAAGASAAAGRLVALVALPLSFGSAAGGAGP